MRMRDLITLIETSQKPKLPKGFTPDGNEYNFVCPYGSGVVEADFQARTVWIHEFQSKESGKGLGRKTIKWLRKYFDHIGVVDPGYPGKQGTEGAFRFWSKMAEEGLVQKLVDHDGETMYENGQWLIDADADMDDDDEDGGDWNPYA